MICSRRHSNHRNLWARFIWLSGISNTNIRHSLHFLTFKNHAKDVSSFFLKFEKISWRWYPSNNIGWRKSPIYSCLQKSDLPFPLNNSLNTQYTMLVKRNATLIHEFFVSSLEEVDQLWRWLNCVQSWAPSFRGATKNSYFRVAFLLILNSFHLKGDV